MATIDHGSERRAYAARLREARETLGLTQDDVAERTGIGRTGISALENATRNITGQELRHLARLYRRTPAWLLGEPEPPTDPALTEATTHLCPQDRETVMRFARFLAAQSPNGGGV